MSRTLIPEFVVGTFALAIWWWLWKTVVSLHELVITSFPQDNALVVSSSLAVLIFGLYAIVAFYCYGIIIERIACLVYDLLKNRRVSNEPV